MPRETDEHRVWKLHTQGLSQREIARQAKIPRTRVQNILKRLAQGSAQVTPSTSPSVDAPPVHHDISGASSESSPPIYEGVPQTALVSVPKVHLDTSQTLSTDISEVHLDIPLLRELVALWPDLAKMVEEWRARKAVRRGQADGSRETRLKTYHVEKRHIEQIAAYAKGAGLSQSEVVNEAFRRFFETR
jgi:hypothetical protein